MGLNIIVRKGPKHVDTAAIWRGVRDDMRAETVAKNRWWNEKGFDLAAKRMARRKQEMEGAGRGGIKYAGSVDMNALAVLADSKFDGQSNWQKNYEAINWLRKQPETREFVKQLPPQKA